MNPLLFQFKEKPKNESFDLSLIEYNEVLNLSIDKRTKKPAIDKINLETETFTRQNEVSDSDDNRIGMMMGTETCTKSGEGTDSDVNQFALLMETSTMTFVGGESSDSDQT
jgi:hypothetical protein